MTNQPSEDLRQFAALAKAVRLAQGAFFNARRGGGSPQDCQRLLAQSRALERQLD